MKTSPNGIRLIKGFETFMPRLYYCAAYQPTIGYGHVIQEAEAALRKAVLTEKEAAELLAKDLVRYEAAVAAALRVPYTQNQFDALVSWCFNVGTGACSKSAKTKNSLIWLVNNGRPSAQIRWAFEQWCKADGTRDGVDNDGDGLVDEAGEKRILAGLLKRRRQEAKLFFTP
ncbi:lysozyme [Hymenobacter sp. CRA2]|uniref:lysozyme n=1 Tax=Hymenobacter sp. CRA2 TaxID=1955620 RepID=UPI00098EAC04|nr:lysozyme [Hymenobacter sp. CRA2]OON67820.1 hypothetical protein B0919_16680 [Hymenobacter sp. CRA2]